MKVLVSGDPHGRMATIDVFSAYLRFLLGTQEKEKPDLVVILGDLFHNHALLRSEILNLWIDYLKKAPVRHVLLVGNHDETAPGSGVHALSALDIQPHMVVPPLSNRTIGMSDWRELVFISYCHTGDRFKEQLAAAEILSDPERTILFAHQAFDGARYENGFYAPDALHLNLVQPFKLVVSGHIHKRQEFTNIWYPGSPYAQSFNDAGEEKYLWLLNTETLQRTPIETPFPKYIIKEASASDMVSIFDKADTQNYYKIVVKDSKAAIQAMQNSVEFKQLKKDYKIVVCPQYVDVVAATDRIADTVTPEAMVQTYISDIMQTELDRKVLLEESLKLLRGE